MQIFYNARKLNRAESASVNMSRLNWVCIPPLSICHNNKSAPYWWPLICVCPSSRTIQWSNYSAGAIGPFSRSFRWTSTAGWALLFPEHFFISFHSFNRLSPPSPSLPPPAQLFRKKEIIFRSKLCLNVHFPSTNVNSPFSYLFAEAKGTECCGERSVPRRLIEGTAARAASFSWNRSRLPLALFSARPSFLPTVGGKQKYEIYGNSVYFEFQTFSLKSSPST